MAGLVMARKVRKTVTDHKARKIPKAAANREVESASGPKRVRSPQLKNLAARKWNGDAILVLGAALAFWGFVMVYNAFHGDPMSDYFGGELFLAVGGVLAGLGFIMRNSAERKVKMLPPESRYVDVPASLRRP